MTLLTSRTAVTSTATARFELSGRVQTGAAALLLSVSALAVSTGAAQAQCVGAVTPGNDFVVCDGVGSAGVDTLGGLDIIVIQDATGDHTGTYTGGAGSDFIVLDNLGGVNPTNVVGSIDGGADDDIILLLDFAGAGLSSVDNVTGGTGADTITLEGASIAAQIDGQAGDDTIDLLSGSADFAIGDAGNDTITLAGASITNAIIGGTENDTIDLLSGSAGSVNGISDNDTITLAGASITGFISGDSGADTIDLLSGSANLVLGGNENDTITLAGASITLQIDGMAGDDTIDLLSGSADFAIGDAGNDTITLNGASINISIDGAADNDTIDLLSGSANRVFGDAGNDTITLAGASITSSIFGGTGNDTINLLSGSASSVFGDAGADTITLDGALININILGGADNDTIDLLSGSASNVFVSAGDDTITLAGASINLSINGGADNDTINLLSGSAGFVTGGTGADAITLAGASIRNFIAGDSGADTIDLLSGSANQVFGFDDNDTITLNGASITAQIDGNNGDDIIDLLSGSSFNVFGGNDNDTITLAGASITTDIFGGDGDDSFILTSGTFGDDLLGGVGSDTATFNPTYDLSTVAGILNGGDDAETADLQNDRLNIIGTSGTLTGENVINWESILVNGATVTLDGNALVTSATDGFGVLLANSTLNLGNSPFAITGEVTLSPGSVLVAETPGGTGVFSVSDDLNNGGTIDMSDGLGAGDTLSVGGNYTSASELLLDVTLDATEAGDSLVVVGDILGTPTEITFTDVAAANPPSFTGTGPGNGIAVVDNSVGMDIADGDFVMDPIAHPTNEILKVPFVYTLSLESDDILYLQSDVLAQVYGYAILSEMMRDQFPTLRDRLGDMRYNGYDSEGNPELGLDNAGLWARIDGSKRDIEHDGGYKTGEWNDTRGEASIGIDIPMEAFGGVGVFGVSIHAVRGYADANSGITPDPNVAEVDTTGFGGGLSFAWFPGGGFYADVQGRVTGWDADVENEARDLKQDIDGLGWGASLEIGNRFQIAPNTAIIPRSQVVYTDVDFDNFKDDDGVDVSQDDSASIVIGPGVTIEQMFPDNGVAMFLDASVKHELLDESSIDASGFEFKSGLEDTWGTVSFGASLGVAEGASAYVAGDVSSPLTSTFGDSYGYGLRAGVRIDF